MNETSNLLSEIEKEDFHDMADILSCGLIRLSMETGTIFYANDTFFQLNNCTKEEYEKFYQNNLFHQMQTDEIEKIKENLKHNSNFIVFYYNVQSEKNVSKCFYLKGTQISNSNSSKTKTYLCTIEDVTNQKLFNAPQFFDRFRSEILPKLYKKQFWEYDILNDTLYRYGEKIEETYSPEKIITNYMNTMVEHNYVHKDDEQAFLHFFQSLIKGHNYRSSVIRFQDYLDSYRWYRVQGSVLFDQNNIPVRIFGTTFDIGKQEKSASSQTELMKKSVFIKKVNECLKLHRNSPLRHAFLLLEIDNYVPLRKTYGKSLLENIITESIIELKNTFSAQILGQLEPSVFGVFYEELFQKSDLIAQVQKYQEIVKGLYHDPATFSITCSVGIMISEDSESSYNLLYRKSEVALSTIRKKGGGFFDFYGHYKTKQMNLPKVSILETTIKNSASLSLIQHTLNLLKTDCLEDALYHYLSHLCQYFQGSHAYIVLKNQVSQMFTSTYQYSTPTCTEDIHSLYQYPFELIGNYETLFPADHCYICCNIDEIESVSPALADSYRLANVKSLMQYALYQDNNWIGYIGIDNYFPKDTLSDTNIAAFYFIGNFLSYAVQKLQRKLCMALPIKRDKLTGLLNFDEFIHQGNSILQTNPNKKFAVIFCDIDHFHKYNQNYGITIGNKALQNLAESFLSALKENELCTRISNDHFAILLTYQSEDDLFSRLVIRSNNNLYTVKQPPDYYRFNVVYGICTIPKHSSLLESLNNAISARKSLKGYTGTHYAIYNDKTKQEEQKMSRFNDMVQKGLNTHQFLPYYQPKFSLPNKELIGFEALARWQHPSGIIKDPNYFLSALKEDNSITELDFQMIQCVCKDIRSAMDCAKKIYPVSINLSISHLMTTNFIERLSSQLRYYEIPFSYIEFEISERYFVYFSKEIEAFIMELKEVGFSIIIDDFGSEYSSLNILRDFDIDAIKIDNLLSDPKNLSKKENIVLQTILQLAEKLGITVYAEKIETQEQVDYLTTLGCRAAQGFYYSKPIPFKQAQEMFGR